MQTEIKHTWFFSQTPEAIWEYLTKADLIAQWLMPNNFEPIAGHEFEFRTNPIPSLNLDGVFPCKVLEIEPLRKLIYTWKGGPDPQTTTLDTVVEWTLEQKDNGTELRLVQKGFKQGNESIFTGMLNGWQQNVQKMLGHLSK